VSNELQNKRADIQQAQKELERKNERLQLEKQRQQAMQQRRDDAENTVMTLEQRNTEVILLETLSIYC
jgi:hypothetical protein